MQRMIVTIALVLGAAAGVPAMAVEPLVAYDKFGAKLIDPGKWFGSDSNERLSTAESVRTTLGGRLHMMIRGYGRTDGSLGTAGGGNRLRFTHGDAVRSMQAKIWVTGYAVTGNTLNPSPSEVKARLAGFFFNAGNPIPGTAVDDVLAQVYVRRRSNSSDPGDVLEIRGSVFRCADATCNAGTTLSSADLGAIGVGKSVVLLLEWDQPNHRFLVQRGNDPKVEMTYLVSDTAPPALDNNKRLEVEFSAANGTVLPRSAGFINAYFDTVQVNQSAAP